MERPVDWTGSVQAMSAAGIGAFLELGPGAVLSGLIKRIDREAATVSIDTLGLGLPGTAA
jgi:[acyl-carrier-protein] S-malonyltransferase